MKKSEKMRENLGNMESKGEKKWLKIGKVRFKNGKKVVKKWVKKDLKNMKKLQKMGENRKILDEKGEEKW